ncbi:MAG: endonuclease/exonuclease/phosphatase, partial [Moorea sp. SIO3C2]|nr:endonuclease/exonuclease/phosphatase [Moorena sp. SIO3C2]
LYINPSLSPNPGSLGERLGFIYNVSMVKRGEVVSDISFDRTKVLETLARNYDQVNQAILPYVDYLKELDQWNSNQLGKRPKKPNIKMPVFLTFARQPFCVSFRLVGHPGTNPYEFMAVNAHLYFGDYISDRRQEFDALMTWILGRFIEHDRAYYPNFILLGDLNLDFDNPTTDRDRIEKHIKMFNADVRGEANVNFPFLDPHPKTNQVLRTNARLTETFDQIGLFNWDQRLPTYKENSSMGENPRGPDYGVFNFVELFSDALYNRGVSELSLSEKKGFFRRFEHEVSDHLPLWLRLPLPD